MCTRRRSPAPGSSRGDGAAGVVTATGPIAPSRAFPRGGPAGTLPGRSPCHESPPQPASARSPFQRASERRSAGSAAAPRHDEQPMSTTVLTLRGVTREYALAGGATLPVLRGVDAELEAGAAVAVTGRSGSGKSTLLHLAAGLDAPTSGEVALLGRPLSKLADAERTRLRRDHVGLVFQFFHLLPHLSVLENVLVPALVAGDRPGPAEARARDLLERVELPARASDPVDRLSGGERQ